MVYLIHLWTPIAHARHYIGTASDVFKRLHAHRAGKGARLLDVANERRISYSVVRQWEGGRDMERKLKARREAPRLCPVCRGLASDADGCLVQVGPPIRAKGRKR